jgi:hypothetical protein
LTNAQKYVLSQPRGGTIQLQWAAAVASLDPVTRDVLQHKNRLPMLLLLLLLLPPPPPLPRNALLPSQPFL